VCRIRSLLLIEALRGHEEVFFACGCRLVPFLDAMEMCVVLGN